MIAELLPPSSAAVEVFGDPAGLCLHPDEQASVGRAFASRRAEFTTGRYCARTALARLGVASAAIPRGKRGEPVWPENVVGSITHSGSYRAAAVARATDLASIGIDAEPNKPLPDGVLERISLPGERARLGALSAVNPAVGWDRLLFSAKESVYKAWYPLVGSMLAFGSADVTFHSASASFVARLLTPGPIVGGKPISELAGRFAIRDGLAITVVTLPPAAKSAECLLS